MMRWYLRRKNCNSRECGTNIGWCNSNANACRIDIESVRGFFISLDGTTITLEILNF